MTKRPMTIRQVSTQLRPLDTTLNAPARAWAHAGLYVEKVNPICYAP